MFCHHYTTRLQFPECSGASEQLNWLLSKNRCFPFVSVFKGLFHTTLVAKHCMGSLVLIFLVDYSALTGASIIALPLRIKFCAWAFNCFLLCILLLTTLWLLNWSLNLIMISDYIWDISAWFYNKTSVNALWLRTCSLHKYSLVSHSNSLFVYCIWKLWWIYQNRLSVIFIIIIICTLIVTACEKSIAGNSRELIQKSRHYVWNRNHSVHCSAFTCASVLTVSPNSVKFRFISVTQSCNIYLL